VGMGIEQQAGGDWRKVRRSKEARESLRDEGKKKKKRAKREPEELTRRREKTIWVDGGKRSGQKSAWEVFTRKGKEQYCKGEDLWRREDKKQRRR